MLTPEISGTPGDNGWYVGPDVVYFRWYVSDPESGIVDARIYQSPGYEGYIGYCEQPVWDSVGETAGVTFTCTATNGAALTASSSVFLKYDARPPATYVVWSPPLQDWYLLVISNVQTSVCPRHAP